MSSSQGAKLDLKAGEWVEVRSQEEILATLDVRGCLENLPFMPEMLANCGQRMRVYKRADKTCDNIVPWGIRRLEDSVHLENSRCDGTGHSDCQAGCLIFWKEAWLKRAGDNFVPAGNLQSRSAAPVKNSGLVTVDSILAATRKTNPQGEVVYSCQATEMREYTCYMKWWDPRQYVRDVRSGNLATGLSDGSRVGRFVEMTLALWQVVHSIMYSVIRERWYIDYPPIVGKQTKTPIEILNIQPGEVVRVKSKEEIIATLDKNNRNRGLFFDCEMLPYCGGLYRVLRRVNHIIDEKTGKMMDMKYPCIVLEGVICKSDYHRLCPKAIFSYWRENWLERVVDVKLEAPQEQLQETCEKC